MFAKAYRTALLAAALLLPTGISYGQMGKIAGKVIGQDGQPLQGAVVRADRQEMRGKQEVKTNKRGEYLFGFLPMGVYNLTLEVGGRQMSKVSNVRPSSAGEPTELDFDLAKLASERAAANRGQVTEGQLRSMTPEQRKAYEGSLKKRRQQISRNKDFERRLQRRHGRDGRQELQTGD